MLKILRDAEKRPDLFQWFGAIAREQIEFWMRSCSLTIPDDLVEFWSQTGGGDLLESETIFRPTQIPSIYPNFIEGDDVTSATNFRIQNGMSSSHLAFHDGSSLSAIQLSRGLFVNLDDKFQETKTFATFDEWYVRTLRAEFGEHYGLPNEAERN